MSPYNFTAIVQILILECIFFNCPFVFDSCAQCNTLHADWLSLLRVVCLKNRVVQISEFNLGVSGNSLSRGAVTSRDVDQPLSCYPVPCFRFRFPRDRYPLLARITRPFLLSTKNLEKWKRQRSLPSFLFLDELLLFDTFFTQTAFYISSNWYFYSILRDHSLLLK